MSAVVNASKVMKSFPVGDGEVEVLKDVNFTINDGEFTIIFGPSGSGKSTILHTILGLEPPSSGDLTFLSEKIYENTTEDLRGEFRKQNIGMIYQQANWVKALTVVENVAFPLSLLGMDVEESHSKALEMLKSVGMEEKADYMPTELSSGQQQRVALARALVNDPKVIIADEPTGNLDFESGQAMMQLLYDLNQKQKKTIIMVTHDLDYLKFASSAIRIMDGKVIATYGAGDHKKLMKELRSKRVLGGKLEGNADESAFGKAGASGDDKTVESSATDGSRAEDEAVANGKKNISKSSSDDVKTEKRTVKNDAKKAQSKDNGASRGVSAQNSDKKKQTQSAVLRDEEKKESDERGKRASGKDSKSQASEKSSDTGSEESQKKSSISFFDTRPDDHKKTSKIKEMVQNRPKIDHKSLIGRFKKSAGSLRRSKKNKRKIHVREL